MIKITLYSIMTLILIVVTASAIWEKVQPIENYINYRAVISYPAYTEAPLDFISILSNDDYISRVDWRDSLMCDVGDGFEEVDVYSSGVDNKTPFKSPDSLIVLAENKPLDTQRYNKWRTEIISEVERLNKGSWKYQMSMDWPTENTLCYGLHKITVKTPWFGFSRDVLLQSSAFWLVGQ